ncbi:MAG: hypothetical protein JOZ99_15225 [Actinobacteria bacterium]|nr:hypothetical protein [Actinomycetota bacterium]
MTTVRRRGLQLDDPLTRTQPAAAETASAETAGQASPNTTRDGSVEAGTTASTAGRTRTAPAKPRAARGREPAPPAETAPSDNQEDRVWRTWSGVTGVGSFRMPHELLTELGDTAREQGLPIGMIVTAAITQLLDQPPARIAALVDRADDARIHGRRHARRRLTGRTAP